MCGLVGMLTTGTTSDTEMKLFKGLLLVDQLRGEHATGVMKISPRKNTVEVIKRAVNAVDFLAEQEVKDFLDKDKVNLYVGHNRYATVGDKSAHENAHPFQQDHITLVHNGGVDPYAMSELEGYNDPKVVVDSHMVCMTIAKHGVKKAVEEHLSGAFALIWWDSKERTLNFIRNKDRPLWFAVTTQGAIVWASEKAFLDVFLERQGKTSGYRTKPIMMPVDELNTFKFNDNGILVGNGPEVTPMEFLEIDYPKYRGAAGRSWWESNAGSTTTSQSGNERSTVELDNAMRVNKILERSNCRLRYGSVVTADVYMVSPYQTNRIYGNVDAVDRDTKKKLVAYGVKLDEIEGVDVVRGTICNAYTSIINGAEILTIVMDKVAVSCHDPKYNKGHPISTSRGDLESARRVQQKIDEMEIEKAKEEERLKNANQKPRLRLVNQINFPLKVHGHTFQSAAEFREFVSQGCASCGLIPEAFNPKNIELTVYQGEKFTGLLEECEFICGKCAEV